jgi:hypothetical protein
MKTEKTYRLEYSEKQNAFHMVGNSDTFKPKENSNGYETISERTDLNLLMAFTDVITDSEPLGLTIPEMKTEFRRFTLYIKALLQYYSLLENKI